VITGAASGIGEALARNLAARGVNLMLTDIDEDGLKRVADSLASNEIRVVHQVMDVSDPEAPAKLAERVETELGGANLVFNNAGIAVGGTFDRVTVDNFDRVMDVNFNAVVRMSRAFLPQMKEKDQAQLVNISSIFGVIAPPGQTAYSASKFAVRGFSMALAHELDGSNVQVTVVHPGGVNTNIAESAIKPDDMSDEELATVREAAKKSLVMPPPEAAEIIMSGVSRRRRRILVGRDAHMLAIIERVFPVRYVKLLSRIFGPGLSDPNENT
jgi:short-subunit dehydrogenase